MKGMAMAEKVTVELPDDLARRVRSVAAQAQRPFEDVVLEWIDRGGAEPSVDTLPDDQLLAICNSQMDPGEQEELADLLAGNHEGSLQRADRDRLANLMGSYRRGLGVQT